MTAPEGAFGAPSTRDPRPRGAFYVWSREELTAALGEEDAAFLGPLLGFAGPPFFEGSHYVLHLPERLDEVARRRRMPLEDLMRELDAGRARLFAARAQRERPATDDKILTDWNGMAITGLAVAASSGGKGNVPRPRGRGVILARCARGGQLLHEWRGAGEIPPIRRIRLPGARPDAITARGRRAGRRAREVASEQVQRLRDPKGGSTAAASRTSLRARTS